MLRDEQQVDFARLALDRIPGTEVDALYLQALSNLGSGRARLGVIQSIGNRKISNAVDAIAPLLSASDYEAAAASAKALGQIGSAEALRALERAPVRDSSIVVEARLNAAHRIGGSDALAVYHEISESSAAPANLRGAALRGLFDLEPDHVAQRLVDAIGAGDPVIAPVVIEMVATQTAPNLIPTLADKLPTWTERAQVAVIAGLGRRGDPAAIPLLSGAAEHGSDEVRVAALTALGELPGNADIAALLAQHALAEEQTEVRAARASLARLNGPGVDEKIVAGATAGDEAARVVYIEALAARYTTSATPLLLNLRNDSSVAVRVAALGSLAELAPIDAQGALLAWAISATDRNEQSRAIRAVASATLRNRDVEVRAQPVVQAIDSADSATALKLLPILGRIGGTNAADAAARLALRTDATLAGPAITSLARWPDAGGMVGLVSIAEKTTRTPDRAAALEKLSDELQRRFEISSTDLIRIVPRALAVATETELRRNLVYVLGRCSEPAALTLAQKFKRETALAEDASDAVLAIRSNREGPPALRGPGNPDRLKAILDGKPNTRAYIPAKAGQWIELDFKSTRPFRHLRIEGDANLDTYPERLEILVTDDDKNPGKALAVAGGRPGKIELTLPRGTRGKHLILRHTGTREEGNWVISELLFD
jgi:HEAT repeat protein